MDPLSGRDGEEAEKNCRGEVDAGGLAPGALVLGEALRHVLEVPIRRGAEDGGHLLVVERHAAGQKVRFARMFLCGSGEHHRGHVGDVVRVDERDPPVARGGLGFLVRPDAMGLIQKVLHEDVRAQHRPGEALTARTIVSTESDLVSAVTAAIGALKGPLHGGAPGPVLDMLRDVHEDGDPEDYVRQTLEAGERLMGFGHRVYRARDPRAAVLSDAAERFYEESGDAGFFQTARELEEAGTRILAEHKPDRSLKTNVELYTAVLLHGIGIPQALFTTTFAAARAGGWMAHALEQKRDNRLVRPVSRYVGGTERRWTPVGERA